MLRAENAIPNLVLFNLRDAAGLTQDELAARLNTRHQRRTGRLGAITGNTISRWESGRIARPSPIYRRLLSEQFGVSLEELGFTRPRNIRSELSAEADFDHLALSLDSTPADPRVEADQQEWISTRNALNENRSRLSELALQLYDEPLRLRDSGLLAPAEWIPARPVDISRITLLNAAPLQRLAFTGREPEGHACRPLATAERRYGRYSQAMRELNRPRLFENRLGYRLLDVSFSPDASGGEMTFASTTYFEVVDTYELLAHELSSTHVRPSGHVDGPSWRRLPARRLAGDPFQLGRRPVMPSVDTLTIRISASGAPSMVLHQRDAKSVSIGGGLLHVMPAGMFQPSSILPEAQQEDFDLWRNIMREYGEEFLGQEEYGGDGSPIDYANAEPFNTMGAARRNGEIRAYCLGVAVDPLTLAVEILTVVVFQAAVYDRLFGGLVDANEEGRVLANPVPFEEHTMRRLLDGTTYALAPAARGCLHLAWEHRDLLLDT